MNTTIFYDVEGLCSMNLGMDNRNQRCSIKIITTNGFITDVKSC